MAEDVSPLVRTFIADFVGSVVHLEILLMLASAPHREWTAEEVARALRIDAEWAGGQLDTLCDQGLASFSPSRPTGYRYRPASEALRAAVAALAEAYLNRRVTVISLIFAKPADGLRAFADAFRLRNDWGPKESDPKRQNPNDQNPGGGPDEGKPRG